MSRHSSSGGGGSLGILIVYIIFFIYLMPVLGIWLMLRKSSTTGMKVLGFILFLIGMGIWSYRTIYGS